MTAMPREPVGQVLDPLHDPGVAEQRRSTSSATLGRGTHAVEQPLARRATGGPPAGSPGDRRARARGRPRPRARRPRSLLRTGSRRPRAAAARRARRRRRPRSRARRRAARQSDSAPPSWRASFARSRASSSRSATAPRARAARSTSSSAAWRRARASVTPASACSSSRSQFRQFAVSSSIRRWASVRSDSSPASSASSRDARSCSSCCELGLQLAEPARSGVALQLESARAAVPARARSARPARASASAPRSTDSRRSEIRSTAERAAKARVASRSRSRPCSASLRSASSRECATPASSASMPSRVARAASAACVTPASSAAHDAQVVGGESRARLERLALEARVQLGRLGLPLQRSQPGARLALDVERAVEVVLRAVQLQLGAVAALAVLGESRRLLDQRRAVARLGVHDRLDAALADHGVHLLAEAGVGKHLEHVDQPAARAVEAVDALAGAVDAARDRDLGEVGRRAGRRSCRSPPRPRRRCGP